MNSDSRVTYNADVSQLGFGSAIAHETPPNPSWLAAALYVKSFARFLSSHAMFCHTCRQSLSRQ